MSHEIYLSHLSGISPDRMGGYFFQSLLKGCGRRSLGFRDGPSGDPELGNPKPSVL
jgi:hypothetical protein